MRPTGRIKPTIVYTRSSSICGPQTKQSVYGGIHVNPNDNKICYNEIVFDNLTERVATSRGHTGNVTVPITFTTTRPIRPGHGNVKIQRKEGRK